MHQKSADNNFYTNQSSKSEKYDGENKDTYPIMDRENMAILLKTMSKGIDATRNNSAPVAKNDPGNTHPREEKTTKPGQQGNKQNKVRPNQTGMMGAQLKAVCGDCPSAGIFSNEEENNEAITQAANTGIQTRLPGEVQAKMEGSFGTSFGGVNIYKNDDGATQAGALAYTQGNNVHFAPGQYNPLTQAGQELIGHELTHVVQQREGKVQSKSHIKKETKAEKQAVSVNNSPTLEQEANIMGKKASEGKKANVAGKGNGMQKAERKQDNVDDLHHKLSYLYDSTEKLESKALRRLIAWEVYSRNIGSIYAVAIDEFRNVVKSKDEYSENLDSICSAVLSGVAAGLLGYVAGLAKLCPSVTKLTDDYRRVAESGIDAARFATYNSGKEIEELYVSQTKGAVSGEIPQVYQNKLLNDMTNRHLLILNKIDETKTAILEARASLWERRSMSEKRELHEQALYSVGSIENLVRINLPPVPEVPAGLNHEFQRAFFKGWIPNLKKVVTKYTEQHDIKHPAHKYTDIEYDTRLGKTMINHFLMLGIIKKDFGIWTSEKDIKTLLNWASSYEVKKMI